MVNDEGTHVTVDLDGVSTAEPDVPAAQAEPFADAALIGGEKLRSNGFFVDIVRRGSETVFSGTSPLVLIVEDDAGTSMVIDAVLKSMGCTTCRAANLQEIRRALSVQPRPDLVLLDILLPDANGFSVLERLRRHPDLGRVPVVMLTSLSEPADVAKGLALGATGYMSKPAQPQALIKAIRTALGLETQP
jgi:two-component system, OmpR family, response regulator